eukprot:COSAG05_NODE_6887_length_887_cov_0.983503_2_plen_201_part_01
MPMALLIATASALLVTLPPSTIAQPPVQPFSCATDIDCSLNGRCLPVQPPLPPPHDRGCQCFAPWSTRPGDELGCGRLDTLPGPRVGAYGQRPHIASWGGNAILHGGNYHLFVSEMTEGCGLANWGSNMDVAHAVSPNATGPYVKVDTALPQPATNPQAIVDAAGDWWLFHIGDASGRPGRNCSALPPAPPRPPHPHGVVP